ncbi:MAG: glycosyltransferase family 2 protein [Solirubrobacterales bacterium]
MAVEFTVGIPTHDRRETVLLAVDSALQQSRPPVRIYVIADGCSDGTQEAVRSLGENRVEVLDRPKAPGHGYAHRNEVLERAKGGVVAWLSDDDLWMPDHLERVGELFDADAADIVNAMSCRVGEDGTIVPFGAHWRAPTYRERFLETENRTPSSAVSHRVDAALAAGGWPTDLDRAGDWDLWKRMVRAGARSEMVLTPTVLFFNAWERQQSWPDRVAQNACFLARLRDPSQLAHLRAEMAFACAAATHADETALTEAHEREASREGKLVEIDAERNRLAAEIIEANAERNRLAGEIQEITSSEWWRLRRPFEPVLRLRRVMRRRLRQWFE